MALPLKDRKTVEEIHDELFPKKTGINADKKTEADLSNIDKEAKKKKKMNPPPVTTAPTTAAFHRVSISPSSGGNAGGCNAAKFHRVSISPSSGGNAGGCNAAKTSKQALEDKNFELAEQVEEFTWAKEQINAAADNSWCGKMTKSLGTVHSKLAAVKGAEPEMREAAKDQLLLALREALHKAENEETAVVERD